MEISAPSMGKKCRPKTPIGISYYSGSNQNVEISAPLMDKKCRPKTPIGILHTRGAKFGLIADATRSFYILVTLTRFSFRSNLVAPLEINLRKLLLYARTLLLYLAGRSCFPFEIKEVPRYGFFRFDGRIKWIPFTKH